MPSQFIILNYPRAFCTSLRKSEHGEGMKLKTSAREELEWGRQWREGILAPCCLILTSLFSPLVSPHLTPAHSPTQLGSKSSCADQEPLALVLTGSCLVSLPQDCGLTAVGWLKVEAESRSPCHFSFNTCRGNKSVEQAWLIPGKEEKGDKERCWERKHKTFHTNLGDSSPRGCSLSMTHSTERGKGK